jgi:hypothetical protein
MLDLQAINKTIVKQSPYPYMVVENSLLKDSTKQLLHDFPVITHPGSIPTESVEFGPSFASLLADLNSNEFRNIIAAKFDLDLDDFPVMTTVRGVMREKDGRIHTDSTTKVITVLLYFNTDWQDDSGHLRILNDGIDIENYADEIAPSLGKMVVFKVTDNCWHGHKPVTGKRLSIQMNYLIGEGARDKHQFVHGLSAKFKNMFSGK